MIKFAKIIEYQDFQIVLQKTWENNDLKKESTPIVKQTTISPEDYEFTLSLGFYNELERDKFFDEYNDTDAEIFVNEVLIINEEPQEESKENE